MPDRVNITVMHLTYILYTVYLEGRWACLRNFSIREVSFITTREGGHKILGDKKGGTRKIFPLKREEQKIFMKKIF